MYVLEYESAVNSHLRLIFTAGMPGSWFCGLFLDLDLSGVGAKLRSCGSEFRRNERSYAATESRYT